MIYECFNSWCWFNTWVIGCTSRHQETEQNSSEHESGFHNFYNGAENLIQQEARYGEVNITLNSSNSDDFIVDVQKLNKTGKSVVTNLENVGMPKSKVKSVARYYSDMQDAIEKCYGMLSDTGMIFFVVGDTEYKGIKILNSKHLVETLFDKGFKDIKIGKRTISKRICIPYRDEQGKFTKDKSKRKVYHEEFIISGRLKK